MVASVVGNNSPSLACLRRLAGAAHALTLEVPAALPALTSSISSIQVRTKVTKSKQWPDQGVLVRLLEDIPEFGPRHAIFRTERGRMRNMWYHRKKAEYLTPARFSELGLKMGDIGARDPEFGKAAKRLEELEEEPDPVQTTIPTIAKPTELERVPAKRAHALLSSLVPPILTFYAKRIELASENTNIFGSVTTNDILAEIKRILSGSGDLEAAGVAVRPENIRIIGQDDSPIDKIRKLGRWSVEISVAKACSSGDEGMAPIAREVQVLGEEAITKDVKSAAQT